MQGACTYVANNTTVLLKINGPTSMMQYEFCNLGFGLKCDIIIRACLHALSIVALYIAIYSLWLTPVMIVVVRSYCISSNGVQKKKQSEDML